jgi:hypothetical protein
MGSSFAFLLWGGNPSRLSWYHICMGVQVEMTGRILGGYNPLPEEK